nr:ribonuclease H-like domain-containing protein [Tanacetum cinerariifolium]
MLKHIFRGRLLASFQDREHEGGDTRSQGGMKVNDLKIKIQDHNMHMIYQRNSQEQGSKFQESDGNDKVIKFVHELKQEIHANLKYVEYLEKEINELESDKAKFSDMYDVILQDCVSKDVMCSYLQSLSDLDALAELQCMYLHKVKECDCLEQKLSKQTESDSKKVHTELLQRFAKVEKHSISLEIALKNCKEQVNNDTVCNKKASNVFRKEREKYFEIQDLKAQLQDKNIAISELKKLIEKGKEQSVDTKPQIKSNQSKDKVPPNNSQVKVKKTQVEVHPRIPSVSNKMKSVTAYKDSLNSKTLNANVVCATCNKCLVDSNHFACVTKMLNDVHARTKKPNVVPISTRKPKSQANKSVATLHKKKIERQSLSGYKWVLKPKKQWVPKAKMQWVPKAKNDQVHNRHMTGNLKLLYNFVEKFLGTVRFGNDQFALIIGYGDLVQGNDQLCSSCELSKAKRSSFKSKAVPSLKGRLNLLHMDLCVPMRVASINGKKYILVIVDDYSIYTWTLFLRSKDETPEVLKDFLTMIQRNLQALVITVLTDRGIEFLNKTLNAFFKEEGIML